MFLVYALSIFIKLLTLKVVFTCYSDGSLEGVSFIDDYIARSEQVHLVYDIM